jgi:uncharacterized protein
MNAFFKPHFFTREFVQRSEWRWWTGLLAGIAILIVPMLIGAAIIAVFLIRENSVTDLANHVKPILNPIGLAIAVIISQILTIIFTIGFARYKTSSWQSKLYLTGIAKLRQSVLAITATALLIIVAVSVWEYFFQTALENDGDAIKGLLHSPTTQFAAIILAVVGAPFSEEMLFRGFLLPNLAKTPIGFLGAAVLTSLVWAAIHWYSWQGAAEIFMIGMAFSYLLWRTGSIIPSIILHMLFNAGFIAINFAKAT